MVQGVYRRYRIKDVYFNLSKTMKKIVTTGFMACALLFTFGCNQQGGAVEEAQQANEEQFENAEMEDRKVNQSDFMTEAASNSMFEVEAGKLAQQKASNQEVKKFGEMMVNDHTNANKELMSLAQQKNITLPDSMGQDHMDHMKELREKTGAEFDQAYMEKMVSTHENAVSIFEDASENIEDAEIKSFTTKTLPKIREHLDKAKKLNGTIKNK